MEVLDPMQVGQRKGKPFSLFRRDKIIDVNRMNRLITGLIATTVAQRFPASGEAGEKDVSHKGYPLYLMNAGDLRHTDERRGRSPRPSVGDSVP